MDDKSVGQFAEVDYSLLSAVYNSKGCFCPTVRDSTYYALFILHLALTAVPVMVAYYFETHIHTFARMHTRAHTGDVDQRPYVSSEADVRCFSGTPDDTV